MTGCFLAFPIPRAGGFDPEEEEEEEEEEAALDVDGDDDDSDDSGVPGASARPARRDDGDDDDTAVIGAPYRAGSGRSSSSRDDHRASRARPRRPCSAPRGSHGRAAEARGGGGGRGTPRRGGGGRQSRRGGPIDAGGDDTRRPSGARAGRDRGGRDRAGRARGTSAGCGTLRARRVRGRRRRERGGRRSRAERPARERPRGGGAERDAVPPRGEARARADPRGAARVPRASGPGDATREALETGAAAFEPCAESRARERSSDARHARGARETYPGRGGRSSSRFRTRGCSSAAASAERPSRTRTTSDPSRRRSFIVRVVAPRAGRMRIARDARVGLGAVPRRGARARGRRRRAREGAREPSRVRRLAEVRAPRRTNAGGVRSRLPLSSFGSAPCLTRPSLPSPPHHPTRPPAPSPRRRRGRLRLVRGDARRRARRGR